MPDETQKTEGQPFKSKPLEMIRAGLGNVNEFLVSLGIGSHMSRILLVAILLVMTGVALFAAVLLPPSDFPAGQIVTVKSGSNGSDVASLLEADGYIRSPFALKLCLLVSGGDTKIDSGDYLFKSPVGACAIANRIAHGITGIPAYRAVITEGMNNAEIAKLLTPSLPEFDATFFVDHARSNEGYLFPDTYFLPMNATAQLVESTMRANFDKKMSPWLPIIESEGKTLRDVVIMASILEKEAQTPEDQAIVSGILWNRIKLGMPLQVDAVFSYLLGKKSDELTQADLKIKSAYNTYTNKGLPPGAIGNPGISAIEAAIHPIDSKYLYYLSDKNGVMHYAKTFEEHKANRAKYLK